MILVFKFMSNGSCLSNRHDILETGLATQNAKNPLWGRNVLQGSFREFGFVLEIGGSFPGSL